MPKSNITYITTKIVLRNDVLSNWQLSTIILEKGEPAVEFDPTTLTSKIKFGDGVHTFSELPYSTMTPNEIKKLIAESGGGSSGGGSINSVELSSGTKDGTLKLIVNGTEYDNIAVTGLGSAAYTDASDYATAEQGARADVAMNFKGFINSLPTDAIIGDTFSVTSTLTIPADISATNSNETVVSGGVITVNAEDKWAILSSGIIETANTANTLVAGISAEITGGVTGVAEAANAGEKLSIDVTEVNTDFLVPGVKTIILNGGSASM